MHANIKSPNSNAYISSSFCGKHLTTFFLFALVSSLIKIILNTFIPSEHWIYPRQTCSRTQYVHFFSLFLVWHRILGTFLHMVLFTTDFVVFLFSVFAFFVFSAGKQDFIGKYFIYVETNNILACMPPVVFLCFPRKKKFHFFLTLVKSNFTKRIP